MHDLPTMNAPARAAFARLTHATAHESMALGTLAYRMRREDVRTVAGVFALVNEMLLERARRLGLSPDEVCDAYEAAATDQQVDMELLRIAARRTEASHA